MTLHLLTDDDLLILREMVREHKQRLTHAPRHAPQTHEEGQSPENHVALVPSPGGLPGRVGTQLGSAECTIYRLSGPGATPTLEPSTAQSRRVYNLSASGIAGGSYVHIWRDKHYGWLTVGGGSDSGIPDTDTGTGTGQPGFPPLDCQPVAVYETDLFCESWADTVEQGGTGLGTGTGTDLPANPEYHYFLNVYRRLVLLDYDPSSGCLVRSPFPWQYVRTVGCCDPYCVTPDTGTGTTAASDDSCCDGRTIETGSLSFTMSGNLLAGCVLSNMSGSLTRFSSDVLLWTNGGGTTSGDGLVTMVLRLYCTGQTWRMAGTVYRTGFAVNLEFDVEATGTTTLLGVFPIGGGCGNASIVVDHPCPDLGDDPVPGSRSCGACSSIADSLTLTMQFGNCTCADQTVTLAWDGSEWRGTINEGSCTGGGANDIILSCDSGTFRLRTATTTCVGLTNTAMTVDQCEPLRLSLTTTNTPAGSCTDCSSGTVVYTVAE